MFYYYIISNDCFSYFPENFRKFLNIDCRKILFINGESMFSKKESILLDKILDANKIIYKRKINIDERPEIEHKI